MMLTFPLRRAPPWSTDCEASGLVRTEFSAPSIVAVEFW
jgi:hypothetical protein